MDSEGGDGFLDSSEKLNPEEVDDGSCDYDDQYGKLIRTGTRQLRKLVLNAIIIISSFFACSYKWKCIRLQLQID